MYPLNCQGFFGQNLAGREPLGHECVAFDGKADCERKGLGLAFSAGFIVTALDLE